MTRRLRLNRPREPRTSPAAPVLVLPVGEPTVRPWKVGVPHCWFCGCRLVEANKRTQRHWRRRTVDHLQPRSRGGTDDPENLALACLRCNQDKGSRTVAEYRTACDQQGRPAFYADGGEPWRQAA